LLSMSRDTDHPTPTSGLRHAVLWVSDPSASAEFYSRALGLVVKGEPSGEAVFMSSPGSTTDHDLGLFRAPMSNRPSPRQIGLYHLAWEVPTLSDLVAAKDRLAEMGALVGENNHGVSRSLYCQDLDGIEFEVMWEVPPDLLEVDEPSNMPLDLQADITRFGATRPGRGG
jgi:catechol-2,3-dioxygenase